jgi:hypothetical protein
LRSLPTNNRLGECFLVLSCSIYEWLETDMI